MILVRGVAAAAAPTAPKHATASAAAASSAGAAAAAAAHVPLKGASAAAMRASVGICGKGSEVETPPPTRVSSSSTICAQPPGAEKASCTKTGKTDDVPADGTTRLSAKVAIADVAVAVPPAFEKATKATVAAVSALASTGATVANVAVDRTVPFADDALYAVSERLHAPTPGARVTPTSLTMDTVAGAGNARKTEKDELLKGKPVGYVVLDVTTLPS